MQLQINTTTKDRAKATWAFAATKHKDKRLLSTRNRAVITAVSKEAKLLGVRVGMRYGDAKTLLPELRVLVYKGGSYA